MSVIDDEVICPECGASLAIHCDVNSEVAILREALERIVHWRSTTWDLEDCEAMQDVARDALDRAGKGEPAPKPEMRSCETCKWGEDMRADECFQCSRFDREDYWTPAASGEGS